MPIYEYRCGHCGARVEVLVWSGGGGGTHRHCGSPLLDRLLSVPFISSGRLLGGQIVGDEAAGPRIDVLAIALHKGMTVEELSRLDLAYVPPIAPVWGPLNGLDSVVSPHFGRCPYYILVDVDGHEVKAVNAVDNPYYGQHAPGMVPSFIHSQGVDVMLTGGMGRRAIASFEQLGVEAVSGASGTVRRALELYLGGQLRGVQPCRESIEHAHEEIPALRQPFDGAQDKAQDIAAGQYEKDEVGRLREEAEMLQQQLDEVMARLGKLEGRQ